MDVNSKTKMQSMLCHIPVTVCALTVPTPLLSVCCLSIKTAALKIVKSAFCQSSKLTLRKASMSVLS